jgi:hypothetical protein
MQYIMYGMAMGVVPRPMRWVEIREFAGVLAGASLAGGAAGAGVGRAAESVCSRVVLVHKQKYIASRAGALGGLAGGVATALWVGRRAYGFWS